MRRSRAIFLSLSLLATAVTAWILFSPRYETVWEKGSILPDEVNTLQSEEYSPNLSPDGRTILFTRGSAGKNTDLYTAPYNDGRIGDVVPLEGINTPFDEQDGMLGSDNHLYFYSDRPGGYGGYDLYSAPRLKDGRFGPAVNLGDQVNSEYNDYDPCLSPSGELLYFSSNRHSGGSEEDYDIYVCRKENGRFSTPKAVSAVNSPQNEWEPMVDGSGRILYFTSNRTRPSEAGGVRTDYDLFASRFGLSGWEAPVTMGPGVNSEEDEFDPCISADGSHFLYVKARRDGTSYLVDIWSAQPRQVARESLVRVDGLPLSTLLIPLSLAACILLAWVLLHCWSRMNTLQRCGLASVMAHLLLAWIFTLTTLKSEYSALNQEEATYVIYTSAEEALDPDRVMAALFKNELTVKTAEAPAVRETTPVATAEPVTLEEAPALTDRSMSAPVRTSLEERMKVEEPAPVALESPAPEAEKEAVSQPAPEGLREPLTAAEERPALTPSAAAAALPPLVAKRMEERNLQPPPAKELPLPERRPKEAPPPAVLTATKEIQSMTEASIENHPAQSLPPRPASPQRERDFSGEIAVAEGSVPMTPATGFQRAPLSAAAPTLPSPSPAASVAVEAPARLNTPAPSPAKTEESEEVFRQPSDSERKSGPPMFVSTAASADPSPALRPAEGRTLLPPQETRASLPERRSQSLPVRPLTTVTGVPLPPGRKEVAASSASAPLLPQKAQSGGETDLALSAPGSVVSITRTIQAVERPGQPAAVPFAAKPHSAPSEPAALTRLHLLPAGSVTRTAPAGAPARPEEPQQETSSSALAPAAAAAPTGGAHRVQVKATEPRKSAATLLLPTRLPAAASPGSRAVTGVIWKNPSRLEGEVNSPITDYGVNISRDGEQLFLTRCQKTGPAAQRSKILFCQREGDGWSKPKSVPALDSEADDIDASLSPDGREIIFYSNRAGGLGGYDIYIAPRQGETIMAPSNPGAPLNSSFDEFDPCLHPDGETIFFTSNRDSGPAGTHDIYTSTRQGKSWSQPKALSINTGYNEWEPALSSDGKTLYFTSDRPGGMGGFDIWSSSLRDGQWQTPVNLGASTNTAENEFDPAPDPSGVYLYFSTNRELGGEAFDLWRVERGLE